MEKETSVLESNVSTSMYHHHQQQQLSNNNRKETRANNAAEAEGAARLATFNSADVADDANEQRDDNKAKSNSSNRIELGFRKIGCEIRGGLPWTGKKRILSSISGDFRVGELTAILGPSGSGKSTLLDILAGFRNSGVSGEVLVNGKPRNLSTFRHSSAYIMQDSSLQPLLTVQEVMSFAADLKLDAITTQDKQRGIDVILKELNLNAARKTLIGKLSDGERKRLAIALELITNPQIMFLDEPTSGLDSVTSRQCIELLKSLALEGRTIICSIHQPSAILLDMIDHLYVIADGQCVYSGGTRKLVVYLKELGFVCPTHYNVADFVLELVNGDYGNHLDQLVSTWNMIVLNGSAEQWRCKSSRKIALIWNPTSISSEKEALKEPSPMNLINLTATKIFRGQEATEYTTNFWRQLWVLLRRNVIKLSRDRFLTCTRISMHFCIAVLIGILYYKVGQDAAYAIDNFNLLFFSIITAMYNAFNSSIISFPEEMPILRREHFNRWYNLRSLYLSNRLSDLPVQITAVTIYSVVIYWMSGQIAEMSRFIRFVASNVLVSLLAQTVGLIFGTLLNLKMAAIFGPLTIMPPVMFSGFFVHLSDAHPYLRWLFHISYCKYAFEAAVIAIYGYDRPRMKCSKDYCHYSSPRQFLKAVDMKYTDYWFSTSVLVGSCIVLEIVSYLTLRFKLRTRKVFEIKYFG
ncbi:hypothetical protein QAD02_023758 [Eretmocerus hayati]|uniref:Uncharacterized protein n=1 Tax=Eretmocerus hayati TaxID=131215 RepID=A0ACC2PXW1_9HYME|nr:hypothetical protein QAD02_023758 [Eretmocerus hayati]